MKSSYLAFAAATTAFCASPLAARPLAVGDVDNLRGVSNPALDPGGNWVAYEVSQIDAKADKSFSHIWMTSWDGARTVQLTNREKESEGTPRWSPDGRYLGFISSRTDKHDNDQLWLLDRTGGEARPLTKLEGSVADYEWSPNGREIALIVLDPDPYAEKDDVKEEDKRPKPIVIDRFQFKRDNDGYLGTRRQRLMVLDVATGATRRLTTGDDDEYFPAWSPDGTRIAFVSNRDKDPDRTYNNDLWVVPASGQAQPPTRLTNLSRRRQQSRLFELSGVEPRRAQHRLYPGRPDRALLLRHAPPGGRPRNGRRASHPQRRPRPQRRQSRVVGGRQVAPRHRRGRQDAMAGHRPSLGRRGPPDRRRPPDHRGDRPASEGQDRRPGLRPGHPSEVYALDGANLRRLSRQNDGWLADVQLAPVEDTVLRSKDGTEVHGFLLKPVNYAGGRVPTILRLHGGPQSQFDYGFSFEWQLLAANGYAVVATNPRGGTGRGQDYAKALYADWGGVAVPDVLSRSTTPSRAESPIPTASASAAGAMAGC